MDTRDAHTVEGFGDEWTAFDQSGRTEHDLRETFARYTSLVDFDSLPQGSVGVDLGCGSGRWARLAAEHLAFVVAADASPKAIDVARRTLRGTSSACVLAAAGALPVRPGSLQFGYSLGVLHHTLDPLAGLRDLVRCLRPGAPCVVYLYYALDNRPAWFRLLWRLSDRGRRTIATLPFAVRRRVTDLIAFTVYWPLSRLARMLARWPRLARSVPLGAYSTKPLYVLRTDALDRFGTRVEVRYTRQQVIELLGQAGLRDIQVSNDSPYWCAVGVA